MGTDNNNSGDIYYLGSDGEMHKLGVGKVHLSHEQIEPLCSVMHAVTLSDAEEVTAVSVNIPEEASAYLWSICEGLEIVPREDKK